MDVKVTNIVVDCNDIGVVSRFWAELLGAKTTCDEGDWIDLEPLGTGGPLLSFQLVPEPKRAKNRLHLDLVVADIEAAGERARALGAVPAGAPQGDSRWPFRVWHDPEGNEFCFCTDH
ncbi:VOC family protein [Actinomadura flavalba]|uniref:VOC family protein n=1 Tax=Actinomadura flavalba TaxID=1120938 RepID=UPI00036EBA7C|nr:VOC family protein [Actinomadura flavalba]